MKELYGERFDYSLVGEYKGCNEKIKVICKKHGVFEVTRTNHERGNMGGCRKCRDEMLTKDKSQFIKEAIVVHGLKYCYDNVVYINNRVKVEIICPIHGPFMMSPLKHI